MSVFFRESRPVARKRHRCLWCGEGIPVGEKYVVSVGIYEGDFQHNKMHEECDKACGIENAGECEYEIDPYSNERPKKS